MKHYGDITKINGAEVPIVDIICGGSPCQDLSVAGKRAGLDGERSGLFMEQIRIVKEQRDECIRQLRMRGADIDVRSVKPRWLIWENVPGAFSSNKGEDFRCVLEEICRIADQTADVPLPAKGKWSTSGAIMGDGWSVAWRVHDAQFWGVPQRRKRISVVADFGGESTPEVLFECESVSRDSEQSGEERKESAGTIGDGTPSASNVFGDDIMPTLVSRLETPVGNTQDGFNVISFQERAGCEGGGKGILIQNERTASIRTQQNQSVLCLNDQGGQQMSISENQTATLRAQEHGHQPIVSFGFEPGAAKRLNPEQRFNEEMSPTLRANMGDNQLGVVCYGMDNERRRGVDEFIEQSPTVTSRAGTGGNNIPVVVDVETEVCVRKYPVDTDKLKECLRSHRNMPMQELADRLGIPKSQVEHYFRVDDYFAIPEPNVWILLKELLGIETDEFDESIMTFEVKPGTYDMSNRIHMGEISPTLKAGSSKEMYCVGSSWDGSQTSPTLTANNANGAQRMPDKDNFNAVLQETYTLSHGGFMVDADNSGKAHTLQATDYKDAQVVAYGVDCYNQSMSEEQTKALTTSATDSDHIPCVAYGLDRASFNQGQNAKFDFSVEEELAPTLVNRGPGGVLAGQ